VDLPANVTGEALRKAVDKLIRAGLLEEVRAHGSLLGWRRELKLDPWRFASPSRASKRFDRPPRSRGRGDGIPASC